MAKVELKGVVIITVDNMTCRQNVWKRAKLNQKIPLLIDARMGAEFARIYAIHPTNIDEADFYDENLYSNDEAERLPCSARSIVYNPTVTAGLIALQVKKFATGESLRKEILLDLPGLALIAWYGEGPVAGPPVFNHFKTYFASIIF